MKNNEFDEILKNALGKTETAPQYLNCRVTAEAKRRKRSAKKVLSTIAAAAACAAVCFVGAVNISPTAAYTMQEIPVIGRLVELVTFRVYEDEKGSFSVLFISDSSFRFPVFHLYIAATFKKVQKKREFFLPL